MRLPRPSVHRPRPVALFLVTMLTAIAIGWSNDYESCVRQQGARDGLNTAAAYFQQRGRAADRRASLDPPKLAALDRASAVSAFRAAHELSVPRLGCLAVFPATK